MQKEKSSCAQEYIVKTEIRDGVLRRNRAVLNAFKCDFGRLVWQD